jgi:uncharacterized membrane protein YfcA
LTVAIGALGGWLLGLTGVGAPPVILFLLSGPMPARTTRAILTAFISTTSFIGLVALLANGAIGVPLLLRAGGLAAVYLAAIYAGMKVFARLSEHGARSVALWLMVLLGAIALR